VRRYFIAHLAWQVSHRSMQNQMPLLTMKPSEYFARQCVVTCDPDDDTILLAISAIGSERILFAPTIRISIRAPARCANCWGSPGISDADRKKILRDKAIRFLWACRSRPCRPRAPPPRRRPLRRPRPPLNRRAGSG
jgi:hypothetical protein